MQGKYFEQVQVAAEPAAKLPHNVIVEDRRTITATGITRIVNYDEQGATLETQQGLLTIGGRGIQVSELSIQTGELKISGQIDYLQYSDQNQSVGGLFRRLAR